MTRCGAQADHGFEATLTIETPKNATHTLVWDVCSGEDVMGVRHILIENGGDVYWLSGPTEARRELKAC